MRPALIVSILALACAATPAADTATADPETPSTAAGSGSVASLAWMAGCWEATGGNGKVTFHGET